MNCFFGLDALPGALSNRLSICGCIWCGPAPGGNSPAPGNVKVFAAVGEGPGAPRKAPGGPYIGGCDELSDIIPSIDGVL